MWGTPFFGHRAVFEGGFDRRLPAIRLLEGLKADGSPRLRGVYSRRRPQTDAQRGRRLSGADCEGEDQLSRSEIFPNNAAGRRLLIAGLRTRKAIVRVTLESDGDLLPQPIGSSSRDGWNRTGGPESESC